MPEEPPRGEILPRTIELSPITLLLDLMQSVQRTETQLSFLVEQRVKTTATLENHSDRLEKMQEMLSLQQQTIERISPAVSEFKSLRDRIKGGFWVLGLLGSLVLVMFGVIMRDLWMALLAHMRGN